MDSDGSSGAGEGGEAFQGEIMAESEGGEGDFGMGQVSGGKEGDDEGSESDSDYSEDLDSDDEIKLGGFSDSEDGDSEIQNLMTGKPLMKKKNLRQNAQMRTH